MRFLRHAFRSGADSQSVNLPSAHSYRDHGIMELIYGGAITTDGGLSQGLMLLSSKYRLAENSC